MENDIFDWLQKWVGSQIDGNWEHETGIKIVMVDNPGWELSVDLVNYENNLADIQYIQNEINLNDWIGGKIIDSYLTIYGDISKLKLMVLIFQKIISELESYRNSNKKLPENYFRKLLINA
jgi:hypothetical protein